MSICSIDKFYNNHHKNDQFLTSLEKASLARKESLEASKTTYQATPPHHYPDMEDTPIAASIYIKKDPYSLALFPPGRNEI